MKKLLNLPWLIVILVLGACSPKGEATIIPSNFQGQLLKFPSEKYENLAILDNKLVAFAEREKLIDLGNNLARNEVSYYYSYEGDKNSHLLSLPQDEICRFTRYWGFKSLPDGQLGVIEDCFEPRPITTTFSPNYRFLRIYEWTNRNLIPLVDGPLGYNLLAGYFAWNPNMTLGVQESRAGTINWITPSGISPMDINIEDQGIKWNLKENYYNHDLCTGIANRPSWSPDGKIVAFFASGEAKKKNCAPHTIFRTNMYFMDPTSLKPNLVLSNVYDPNAPAWSPDSKKVAFWGCNNPHSQCKVWIFSQGTKQLSLIYMDNLIHDITWITNTEIALIKCFDTETDACGKTEIWKYDLSQ